MKKYELLTDETKVFKGRTLYRIKALIDFLTVKAGDLGGWIEKEENLSQEGQCWVYDDACVYDNARVYDNACVCDNAKVFDSACVYDNACVCDNAKIFGSAKVFGIAKVFDNAWVYCDAWIFDNTWVYGDVCIFDKAKVFGSAKISDNACVSGIAWVHGDACVSDKAKVYDSARVFDNAKVSGSAWVSGIAWVSGNASVSGNAWVYDSARVFDNAKVSDNAHIFSNAKICDNARVCEDMQVSYSYTKTDLRKDIAASLRCQCNLLLTNNKVIAYKIVNKDLSSLHDKNFIYEVGKIAEVKDAEESNESCANGLHFSNLTYWDFNVEEYTNKTYLVAEIDVEDIITIQRGKIRCRKAKILEKVDII